MANPLGTLISPQYDRFHRTHERVMWELSSIDFDKIQPDLLSDTDLEAVRGVMLVESHNPHYTDFLLHQFSDDHEMAAFVITWGYEELKHYLVLRTYLEATGRVNQEDLNEELRRTRSGPLEEIDGDFSHLQFYAYGMLQEQITGSFYKRFAEATTEPVLKDILLLIGKDEYRHCQWYLEKGKAELLDDPRRVGEVVDILSRFSMPGPTFIEDYAKYTRAFLKTVRLDLSAMKESMSKIEQLTGKLDSLKAATRVTYMRRISESFGAPGKEGALELA